MTYVVGKTPISDHRDMIDFLKGSLFNLAINLMGSTKHTSGDSLTPLGTQNKGFADIRDRSLFIAGGERRIWG